MLRFALSLALAASCYAALPDQIQIDAGKLQGMPSKDGKVQVFEGIPFAAPPVGDLRWQPPQPPPSWDGVRKATAFGPRCMQAPIFKDMIFRDAGPSEDCLYLNVWTPADSVSAKLPVMVWIYGGGFMAGASSEPRQDGSKLAEKGVIVVSMNYRLGIFGFFAHPELTRDSPHHASGNQGFLDQAAAIAWVRRNIAAFGGDPDNITIFGESAGSMSVSAQMASPVSKDLIKHAIGESGSMLMLGARTMSLADAEQQAVKFGTAVGAAKLADLRAIPAEALLKDAGEHRMMFWPIVDGYFFPASPNQLFAEGKQAHIPLLAGWNTDEQSAGAFFGRQPQTKESYEALMKHMYGEHADEMMKAYPASNEQEMKQSAGALAGDRFIAYSTWKWTQEQIQTGDAPVYRYHFEEAPPQPAGEPSRGAYHSSDIQYVFETLDSSDNPWTDADRKLSDMISSYWTNFAKTGDPNGSGLPNWPQDSKQDHYEVMHLVEDNGETPHAAPSTVRTRYETYDRVANESK